MHRLDVATDKLAVAKNSERWSSPGNIYSGDIGNVVIVREVCQEITDIYCDLSDWAREHIGIADGPWVGSFDEDQEAAS